MQIINNPRLFDISLFQLNQNSTNLYELLNVFDLLDSETSSE
jgi:hypothetical protein